MEEIHHIEADLYGYCWISETVRFEIHKLEIRLMAEFQMDKHKGAEDDSVSEGHDYSS